jgi:ABC-type Fe3+/spermidine/putrescine transport system ATPase subunit
VAAISLAGVSKTFGDGTLAVADLDLDIAHGELLVVVGPSGCGKSTVLRKLRTQERSRWSCRRCHWHRDRLV